MVNYMNLGKKILSFGLAAVMAASLSTFVLAESATLAETATPAENMSGQLVILHTNDTHGRDVAANGILGTAAVAQLKKDYEAAGADVLLFSAGDACQGTALVNQSQGKAAVKFMNAAGYDAMVPGNHEFDWGLENLLTLSKEAKFPVLAANIVYRSNHSPVFEEHRVFTTKSGKKVGVFGLITPETATGSNPAKVKDVEFLAGDELYDCAQKQVDALKAEGCGLIVALSHLGVDPYSEPNRSEDVLRNVEGIDLLIDGHSHTAINDGKGQMVGNTLLVSTGQYLENIGVVVYDGSTLTPGYARAGQYQGSDPAVSALVNTENEEVDKALSATFGRSEVLLNGERAPGNRTEETNLGDFSSDAVLWFAQKETGLQIAGAILNGGGIREDIPAGEVSMKTMKTVFPFDNTVAVLTVTGQELLEALEAATFSTPEPLGAFPQVAGISFTVDCAGVYEKGDAYSTFFKCVNPGTRIKNVMVAGEPLDLKKSYTIATNDFVAAGGDTYYPFQGAYQRNGIDTGLLLEDALVTYTKEVLGGVITAEQYREPAGRITVLNAGSASATEQDAASNKYVVKPGDSLWSIAQKELGAGTKWEVIYQLNRDILEDPDRILAGQELKLSA